MGTFSLPVQDLYRTSKYGGPCSSQWW